MPFADTPPSLRRITFRFMAIGLLVFSTAVFTFLYVTIPSLLEQGEDKYFAKQLEFIRSSITESERQAVVAGDNISVWDEAVVFARGLNPSFIQSNWPGTTPLKHLSYNFIIIKDAKGNDLYIEFYDYINNISLNEKKGFSNAVNYISDQVAAERKNPSGTDIQSIGKSGAFLYDNTLYLMSIMPILEDYNQQYPDGTVILGHILDIKYFNKVLRQDITTFSVQEDVVLDQIKPVRPVTDEEMIFTFTLSHIDSSKDPIVLTLNTPRIFHLQAITALDNISFFLIIVLVLSSILLYYILNKHYIRPMEHLSGEIDSTSSKFSIDTQKREYSSEFIRLRFAINDMLQRLKKSNFSLGILRSVVSGSGNHICVSDRKTDEILFMNDPLLQHLGLEETPVGRKCWEVFHPGQEGHCANCPFDGIGEPGKPIMWDSLGGEGGPNFRNTGTLINWFDGRLVRLHSRLDITELKTAEEDRRRARLDPLTGLGNRNAYLEQCAAGVRSDKSFGVVFIDLNDLKFMNDTYGHAVGDDYIQSLSSIFCRHFRSNDIFRIGGDEFVILCSGMPKTLFHEKIEALRQESEACFPGSLAMGAVWEQNPTDVEAMVREADQSMYADKQQRKRLQKTRQIPPKPDLV